MDKKNQLFIFHKLTARYFCTNNDSLYYQYNGVNIVTNTFDDIHPNTKGEKIMAERWFEAIKDYLKKLQ